MSSVAQHPFPHCHARRGRVGRSAELHRGAPGHPDHRPRAAHGRDGDRARACSTTGSPRSSRPSSNVDTAQLPQPYTLNDVVCWFLAVARPARGGLHAPAQHPARRELRAAARAAPARADHRLRPLRHHDLRSAARAGDQRRALPGRAIDRGHRLRAEPRRRPRDRARPAAAPGGLSPARAPVRVAHLRHLRRGHAGVHLRAAKRAPDAREALPRARAQPPAASSAAASPTGSRACSCAWPSATASPIRATWARCSPTAIPATTDA